MATNDKYPDCIRFNPKHNSTVFAVTNDEGKVVAVHEVFLTQEAKEIGRRTVGLPEEGYVRFPGIEPVLYFNGEPEDGMEIWIKTGQEMRVNVSGVLDTWEPD